MGMVATLREHRRKGLQRILNAEYDRCLAEDSYDLSVIEGIPYFYRQFGYEYTIPLDTEAMTSIEKIPNYPQPHEIRPFTYEDLPKVKELLKRSQRKFLVHRIRDEEIWRKQEETGWQADWPFETYIVEEDGEAKAYLRLSRKGDNLYLVEVSETDRRVSQSILSFLRSKGVEEGAKELLSRVSHDEPFTDYLVEAGGKKKKPYAWQIKVVNHERLLRKLTPLFERRLRTSHMKLTKEVTLNFYKFGVRLRFDEGKLEEVSSVEGDRRGEVNINPVVFPQLLLGVRSTQELQDIYPDIHVNYEYCDILDTIFPKKPSFIHACY